MTGALLELPNAGVGLRAGGPADAVDGIQPAYVARPGSVAEVAAVLRATAAEGPSIVARGGGTKIGWGGPPRSAEVLLDLAELTGVLEHNPGDLVVRAEAGLPLAALQDRLAGSGQRLALDPPEAGATLGGVVATAASGPRRLRYGTPRDLLIGITVVLADGSVAHAGGKVVKNVAGYDLGKLFAGSFGTLGVVVETTWRLHPLPATAGVVLLPFDGPDAGGALVARIAGSQLVPAAVELDLPAATGGSGRLAVLFEGVGPAVRAQADAAAGLHPEATVDAEPPGWFGERPWADGRVGLQVSLAPAALPTLLHALAGVQREFGLAASVRGRALTGALEVSWPDTDAVPAGLDRLRRELLGCDGSVVVAAAPTARKHTLDVWGPSGDAMGLMRRVKAQFDPAGRLSPGRFVGGI